MKQHLHEQTLANNTCISEVACVLWGCVRGMPLARVLCKRVNSSNTHTDPTHTHTHTTHKLIQTHTDIHDERHTDTHEVIGCVTILSHAWPISSGPWPHKGEYSVVSHVQTGVLSSQQNLVCLLSGCMYHTVQTRKLCTYPWFMIYPLILAIKRDMSVHACYHLSLLGSGLEMCNCCLFIHFCL